MRRIVAVRLSVANRYLVVIGVNFAKSQEAVPMIAVLDKCRLQRRFNAGNLGEVDVTLYLLLSG